MRPVIPTAILAAALLPLQPLLGQRALEGINCSLAPDRTATTVQPAVLPSEESGWRISNAFGNEVTNAEVAGLGTGRWRHTGIDLLLDGRSAASGGQPVHAVADGVVVFSTASNPNPIPERGGLLIVRHLAPDDRSFRIPAWSSGASAYPQSETREFLSYYLHLSPEGLHEQGKQVTAGEVIGRTYTPTEKQRHRFVYVPHLHLEIWSVCSPTERNGYDSPGREFDSALGHPVIDPKGFLDENGGSGEEAWVELDPGGSAGSITFREDHTVILDGRVIARGNADETVVLVSPPSPVRSYRIILLVDTDVGARHAYVSGGTPPGSMVNLAPDGWVVQRWVSWSPSDEYAVLAADGEVTNGDLLVVRPQRGTARILEFRSFSRTGEMQEIVPESIHWQTPAVFGGELQILCNPYEEASCPDRPLRTQRFQVNASTLAVSYPTAER